MIGDNIEIKILAIEGDQIKIGIVAPKAVKVHRAEIFEAIREQNRAALNVVPSFIDQLKRK